MITYNNIHDTNIYSLAEHVTNEIEPPDLY